MALDLSQIKELIKLAVDNKLDSLEFEGLKISKSKYDIQTPIKSDPNKSITSNDFITDPDEILYWSSSAPALTQEQIDALSYPAIPKEEKPKRARKAKVSS